MKTKVRFNWLALIYDLAIIALALYVSLWQDNPRYLWLLVLIVLMPSGSYKVTYEE